jgi:Mlc titration factor MtfA (ptsG expression regulator)
MINLPKPGDRIWNGAIVIEYTHKEDEGNGSLANGIALCVMGSNSPENYVVWRLMWNPSYPDLQGSWQAEGGLYHSSIKSALTAYNKRVSAK